MILFLEIIYYLTVITIWISTLIAMITQYGAYRYDFKNINNFILDDINNPMKDKITIIIPAHNEAKVILTTCRKIIKLNYPKNLLQIIIVNDASTDNSGELLEEFKNNNLDYDITILSTTPKTGGKGKSYALNLALKHVKYNFICIYDADAAPEKNSLRLLVNKINEDKNNYACCGRNKCRNRDRNLLTRFINLELTVSQKVVNKGNYELFGIGKIPGTNYLIKKEVLDKFGGFNTNALTEDTDLSFKMHINNMKIAYEPRSEAYQQEPEELKVFIKQRTRWAQGNLNITNTYFRSMFKKSSKQFKIAYLLQISIHYWFIMAILFSNIFFVVQLSIAILNLVAGQNIDNIFIIHNYTINTLIFSWAILYLYFILNINYALSTEKGQYNSDNFILSIVYYFTYAQLFLIISVKAIFKVVYNKIKKRENEWYKTQRY